MEDALDFLQSRPLIGFQMDGSHLNNVLQNIIHHQQQLAAGQRQVAQRLGALEEDVAEVRTHQQDLERALGIVGGDTEKLRQIRGRLEDLEGAMDRVTADLDETKRLAAAAAEDADQAGRLADQANRVAAPIQGEVRQLAVDMDQFVKQSTTDRRELVRALEQLDKGRVEQEEAVAAAVHELQARVEKAARENGAERLRVMLEELSDRTDENFRSVEESARAVDAELSRQAQELHATRSELGSLEDRTRTRISALAGDTDEKYQVLLNAFREYERANSELEEHLVMAGQALARRQGGRQRSPLHR